jgi:hypothetical protein
MKTLLRHASTGKYFQSLDKWTPEREQAHDFGIVRRAIKFAQKMRISDLELILSFDEPQSLGSNRLWRLHSQSNAPSSQPKP